MLVRCRPLYGDCPILGSGTTTSVGSVQTGTTFADNALLPVSFPPFAGYFLFFRDCCLALEAVFLAPDISALLYSFSLLLGCGSFCIFGAFHLGPVPLPEHGTASGLQPLECCPCNERLSGTDHPTGDPPGGGLDCALVLAGWRRSAAIHSHFHSHSTVASSPGIDWWEVTRCHAHPPSRMEAP